MNNLIETATPRNWIRMVLVARWFFLPTVGLLINTASGVELPKTGDIRDPFRITDSVETIAGRLQIESGRQWVRVSHVDKTWAVTEEVVKLYMDNNYVDKVNVRSPVRVEAIYPIESNARLIFLSVNKGGRVCPGFWKVLEIKSEKEIVQSQTFGNCSDMFVRPDEPYSGWEGLTKENPVFTNGEWKIGIGALGKNRKKMIDWFSYRNGVVYFEGEPAIDPDKDPDWLWKKKLEKVVKDKSKQVELIKKYGSARDAYYEVLSIRVKKIDPAQFR